MAYRSKREQEEELDCCCLLKVERSSWGGCELSQETIENVGGTSHNYAGAEIDTSLALEELLCTGPRNA